MLMQTFCKKGMKMKKAVNTLNLYLPFLTFHDGIVITQHPYRKLLVNKA